VGSFGSLYPLTTTWVRLTCKEPADMDVTEGTFWFNFTIGKVAKKTTDSAIWQIAATANSTDYGMGFGYDDKDTGYPVGVKMLFYSEVSIAPPSPTVDWGLVPPGLDFGEGTASEQSLGADVTYIANGDYDEKVSSDDWAGGTYTATLDETGACDDAQEFALKAAVDGTLPGDGLVTKTPGTTIASGTITEESGKVESANTLWLKLASSFTTAEYSGTITYSVAEV